MTLPGFRPPPAAVAAMSSLDTACAAPTSRTPGLVDGGLESSLPPLYGRPPSQASTDAAASTTPAGAAPSPLIAADDAPPGTPAGAATSSSTTAEAAPSLTPVDTAPGLDTELVSWSSLADDEDEDDDELAPRTPPLATNSSVSAARSGVACDADVYGGWQKVLPQRSLQRPASPAPALHWLPVASPLGFMVDVADASFLDTVRRIAEILLCVLGALRMVIERVSAAMPGVPSVYWEALLCRHCPASPSGTIKLQLLARSR